MYRQCGSVYTSLTSQKQSLIINFFGRLWLRLQVAKVPELTPAPAPTYLGQLRLLEKRRLQVDPDPAAFTKIYPFKL